MRWALLALAVAALVAVSPAAARRAPACPAGKHPRAERWTVRIHGRDRQVTVRICRRNRPTAAVAPAVGAPLPLPATAAPPVPPPPVTPAPTTPATPPAAQYLQVQAREFSLTLSRATVVAGTTGLEFLNRGQDPHDLHLRPADGSDDIAPPFPELAPGGRATRSLTLPAGSYVLYCAIAGHEQLGMRAPLTVVPAR